MPISAVDTVSLAFEHTKRQLLQPFRFWQWVRLAFVGLMAGELGSGGSFHFPSKFPQQGSSRHFLDTGFPKIDPAIIGGLIATLVLTGLVFLIVMTYISSVMRFILFDSVLKKECHIRDGWSRRQGAGWRLFWWQIGFMLVAAVVFAILVGIPAAIAFSMGWFSQPHDHVAGLVLGGLAMLLVVAFLFICITVVHVFTKDFVVPQMAMEEIGAVEGWRRLWPMLQAEFGGYAGYAGMKIVMAIGAAIVVGIASIILIILLAIPGVGLGVIAAITGKAAGLTWNVFTITMAVVAACIVFGIFMYLVAMISVPVIVFFPAYAMYFFAARYRPLSLALYPPPPDTAVLARGGPPPMPLTPEPAR